MAAYLIDTVEGITVVDAGLAGHLGELTSELAGLGRSLDDIRGVILTHGDSDQPGFAERLRRNHGVPIFNHGADAGRARGEAEPETICGRVKLGATARFLWYAGRSLLLFGRPRVRGRR